MLREAKATTLGIVLLARSCAIGGEDVVGEARILTGNPIFFIVGGLYSVTALREKTTMRVTVCTKHRLTNTTVTEA